MPSSGSSSVLLWVGSWEVPSYTSSLRPWNFVLTSLSSGEVWERPILPVGLGVLKATITSLVVEKLVRHNRSTRTLRVTQGSRGLEDRSILQKKGRAQKTKKEGGTLWGEGPPPLQSLLEALGLGGKLSYGADCHLKWPPPLPHASRL